MNSDFCGIGLVNEAPVLVTKLNAGQSIGVRFRRACSLADLAILVEVLARNCYSPDSELRGGAGSPARRF